MTPTKRCVAQLGEPPREPDTRQARVEVLDLVYVGPGKAASCS